MNPQGFVKCSFHELEMSICDAREMLLSGSQHKNQKDSFYNYSRIRSCEVETTSQGCEKRKERTNRIIICTSKVFELLGLLHKIRNVLSFSYAFN